MRDLELRKDLGLGICNEGCENSNVEYRMSDSWLGIRKSDLGLGRGM